MQTGVFQTGLWFGEESLDFEEATQAGLLESSSQQIQGPGASAAHTILVSSRKNASLQVMESSAPYLQADEQQQQAMLHGLALAQPAASLPEPASCQRRAQSLPRGAEGQSDPGMEYDGNLQHIGCDQIGEGAMSCQQHHQQDETSSWQGQPSAASSSALLAMPPQGTAEPLASSQQQQHKRRKTFVMPDIEEAGLCLDRQQTFRYGRGLSVTDFTASEWCQQQVAFNLSAQLPKVQPLVVLCSL